MARQKNVLFIITDQQRRDSLGCYGNPVCRTPNLDRLAARGVRFDRNYVANPICMPSRLSIFTGTTPRSHGLWTNGLLIDERDTLPGHFLDHGYRTGSVGKIHFTPTGADGDHMESSVHWAEGAGPVDWHGPYWGFEHVDLTIGHTALAAHYREWFYANGGTDEMRKPRKLGGAPGCSVFDMPPELHDSAFVADRSIDFIQRHADEPFFLVASFPDPHAPFNPPAAIAERYSPDDVVMPSGSRDDLASRPEHYRLLADFAWSRSGPSEPKRPGGLSEAHTRERIALTYAMVELIDHNVGRLLDCLKEQGLEDDTIVVFTADHGELLGDFGLWAKGPFFYDCLINTPLIIAQPGTIEPGVSQALFSDLDLAPTLCDLAGVPPKPFMDGISQLPHLQDRQTRVRDHCLVEYRNGYGDADVASKVLVTDDRKYVRYQTGEEELTDLAADPEERHNVAADPDRQREKEALRLRLLDAILQTEPKGPAQLSHA